MLNDEAVEKRLREITTELIDSVDSVIIIVTRYDGQNTPLKYSAQGNSYAIQASLDDLAAHYRKPAEPEPEP